jgi:hypothetical protein
MKKYFLTKDNQELKVGDKITLTKSVDTSYGVGKLVTEVRVTEDILEKLVKGGHVRVEESDEFEGMVDRLRPYIRRIARKNQMDFPTTCGMLDVVLRTSPKAHLQLLIETIAEVKNRGKEPGKDNWHLNPLASYRPTQIAGNPTTATVFYEAGDALEAHRTLLPLIKGILYGEQEN